MFEQGKGPQLKSAFPSLPPSSVRLVAESLQVDVGSSDVGS